MSGNRDSQNIWQKIRAYHKLTIRISGHLLLGAGTFMIPRAKKFGVEGL